MIKNQVLEEFGNTEGKRDWAKGGWRVGRFRYLLENQAGS